MKTKDIERETCLNDMKRIEQEINGNEERLIYDVIIVLNHYN